MRCCIFIFVFLSIHTMLLGQEGWDTEIKKCFREEDYGKVIALCRRDASKYIGGGTEHDIRRELILRRAMECFCLDSCAKQIMQKQPEEAKLRFQQIIAHRTELWKLIGDNQPILHPQTELWMAKTENPSREIASSIILSSNDDVFSRIISRTRMFLSNLRNAYFARETKVKTDSECCTSFFEGRLVSLWENGGHFYCTAREQQITNYPVTRSDDGGWAMNIPVIFEYNEKSVMTLEFNNEGKINNIRESLAELRYKKIEYGVAIDSLHFKAIRDFVEAFRIAYIKRDIDFIETAFSEHAVIITGKDNGLNIKTASEVPVPSMVKNDRYRFTQQSREQYIQKLQRVFANNKRINVEFSDIEVQRHHEFDFLYGVTLKQMWYSTTYSDEGWVFLLIKFRKDEKPIIFVRTWQPETWGKENVFGFNDFELH